MASSGSRSPLWVGKPWIVPAVAVRTILVIVIAIVILWLEMFLNIGFQSVLGVPLVLWTGLVFFVVWLVSVMNLVIMRATNTYVLRDDSLEIRTGILTSRSFVISPGGFADMEVVRSVSGRIMNLGSIIIRTQAETIGEKHLIMVRNSENVAKMIREIMAKPIVRIDKDR